MAVALPDDRYFWRVWSAASASNLADGIRSAAFPLLAASLTREPLAVAGVVAAQQLPWLVFGLVGGTLADRVDARRLVSGVNALRAAGLLLMAVAIVFGALSWPLLVAVAFLVGAAEAIVDSAYPNLVVATVAERRLEWANGRLTAGSVVGNELVGPAVGSWLFAIALALPVAVDGGLLAAAVLFVLSLPAISPPAHPPSTGTHPGFREDLVEGIRWLARHRRLRTVTSAAAVLMLLDAAWFAILVLFALEELGMGAAGFGLLLGLGAVGGVIGSVLTDRLAIRTRAESLLVGSLVMAGVSQVAVGLADSVLVVGAALAASSGAFAVWNVTAATMRQREAPAGMLGRLSGTSSTVLVVAGAFGALLGGAIAGAAGLRTVMLMGGPLLLATAAWLRRSLDSNP